MQALEIGPSDDLLPGFDGLDMVDRSGIRCVARWGFDPLPIPDESYDLVFASHVLEHIPWNRTLLAIQEAYRILRRGGELEVWVPDFAYIVRCYLRRECGDAWRRDNPRSDPMLWVNGRIFTYGPAEDNWHHACFDEAHLRNSLSAGGLVRTERIAQRTRGVSHGPIDLGMRGWKP